MQIDSKKCRKELLVKVFKIPVIMFILTLFIFTINEGDKNQGNELELIDNTYYDNQDAHNAIHDNENELELKELPVEITMQYIDERVAWIIDNKQNFTYKRSDFHEDYYHENSLVYRLFNIEVDTDGGADRYILFYDENGNIIFGDIGHYRSTMYSIYFHNDSILYVVIGTIFKGDLEQVKNKIKENDKYAFIIEDIELCLKHAYDGNAKKGLILASNQYLSHIFLVFQKN